MRAVRFAVLVVAVVAAGAPAPAAAAYECAGRRATVDPSDVQIQGGTRLLVGTSRDDVIVGSAQNEEIRGRGGDDIICGRGGRDYIVGGRGHDALYAGGRENNTLNGGAGNDRLYASRKGPDDFVGDWLEGGSGHDVLVGTASNEQFVPGRGDDRVRGRGGADTVRFGIATRFDMATGVARNNSGRDRISGVENVMGSAGNDVFLGDAAPNYLSGAGGDDVLNGRRGADNLQPGVGDDTVHGGRGRDWFGFWRFPDESEEMDRDRLFGGPGFDAISLEVDSGPAHVDLESGTAQTQFERITLDDIEEVWGTWDGDYIAGDDGPNRLVGFGSRGQNDDVVVGRGGDDILSGWSVDGGPGTDFCMGDVEVNCE